MHIKPNKITLLKNKPQFEAIYAQFSWLGIWPNQAKDWEYEIMYGNTKHTLLEN